MGCSLWLTPLRDKSSWLPLPIYTSPAVAQMCLSTLLPSCLSHQLCLGFIFFPSPPCLFSTLDTKHSTKQGISHYFMPLLKMPLLPIFLFNSTSNRVREDWSLVYPSSNYHTPPNLVWLTLPALFNLAQRWLVPNYLM